MAQRTLRKEPAHLPNIFSPRSGCTQKRAGSQQIKTTAKSCLLGLANFLPQDHHLESYFRVYYPLKTIVTVSIKPAPDGTYLLFPSRHLDTDGVMYVNIPSVHLSVPITISRTPWVLQ